MTIVYGGMRWHLEAESAWVHPTGEDPRPVELDALPLPVARVLRSLRPRTPKARAA